MFELIKALRKVGVEEILVPCFSVFGVLYLNLLANNSQRLQSVTFFGGGGPNFPHNTILSVILSVGLFMAFPKGI